MFWLRFLKNSGILSRDGSPEEGEVCSTQEFHKCLKRARARSDRNARSVSVAVFDCAGASDQRGALRKFAPILVRRVRMTDVVGWFDQRRLAVLLYETSSPGAWKLVEDVCEMAGGVVPKLECHVYTYPYENKSNGGTHDQVSPGGTSPRDAELMSFSLAPKSRFPSDESSNGQSGFTKGAMRLEPVLAHPIPLYKRIFDILLGTSCLLVFSPAFLLIALLIKILSPGPVFFTQQRIGYLGQPFTFWKFRTMDVHRDASKHKDYVRELIHCEKPMQKMDDDPQIIPVVGKLLRKSCLDELPQLFNVLRGDMSLIGPRPCLPYEYEEFLLWHKRRFETLPGMTGLWQVSGKNRTSFRQMVRYDIAYEYRRSLWFDLKILLKTPSAILGQMVDSFARRRQAHETLN